MKLEDVLTEELYQECIKLSWNEVKEKIENIATIFHSPQLIDVSSSPNENTIYIIWNDGEISEEKGSYAFGQRNVRTYQSTLTFKRNVFNFPFVRSHYRGVILSVNDCIIFRKFLDKIFRFFRIY